MSRKALIIGLATDVWGRQWDVRERRDTSHGFTVSIGWPSGEPRGGGVGRGVAVVMTPPLAQYITDTRQRDIDLPIGITAVKRLRSALGVRWDWDDWWRAKEIDLRLMTLADFAERHGCSTGAASRRRAMLLPIRPGGLQKIAHQLIPYFATIPDQMLADALGVSRKTICGYRNHFGCPPLRRAWRSQHIDKHLPYLIHLSDQRIGELFSLPASTVTSRRKTIGLRKQPRKNQTGENMPKVQTHLTPDTLDACNARGSVSGTINRSVTRYVAIVEHSAAVTALSDAERDAVRDACRGWLPEPVQTIRGGPALEVADALADGLAEAHGIDGPALVAKLRALSFADEVALVDDVERYWHSVSAAHAAGGGS